MTLVVDSDRLYSLLIRLQEPRPVHVWVLPAPSSFRQLESGMPGCYYQFAFGPINVLIPI